MSIVSAETFFGGTKRSSANRQDKVTGGRRVVNAATLSGLHRAGLRQSNSSFKIKPLK